MKWQLKPFECGDLVSPYAHVMWERHKPHVHGYVSVAAGSDCRVRCHHGRDMPQDWLSRDAQGDELRSHALPVMLPDDVFAGGQAKTCDPPTRDLKADTAFIGVIDTGIAFAHERFRWRACNKWHTRFDLLWLQGAPANGRAEFGRLLYHDEIERRINDYARHDVVNEDALYRSEEVRLIDMSREEMQGASFARSHGTAVLDLAGGIRDCDDEDPENHLLLAVDLPSQIVRDSLGTFVEHYIAAAIWRMIDHVEDRERQAANGQTFPIVINISFALSAGSKDGSGLLEAVMRAAQEKRRGKAPVRFVLPAGNHRLSRANGRLSLSPGQYGRMTLCLLPDDRTPSFVEFWGPPQAKAMEQTFTIRITLPGGARTDWLPIGHAGDGSFYFDLDQSVLPLRAYVDSVRQDRSREGGRQRITVVFPPTIPLAEDDPEERYVDPGDYEIDVRLCNGNTSMTVDVHVQRDDTLPGFRRRGRQSVLVDADYRERDRIGRRLVDDAGNHSTIHREGTINTLANGSTPLLVGGLQGKRGQDAFYSGLGSGPDPDIPHVHAITERGDAAPGILAHGSHSGRRLAVSGTSFAAPQVAREEARALGKNPHAAPLSWLCAEDWEGPSFWGDRPLLRFRARKCSASAERRASRAG